ncbi:MAG: hypothetical protein HW387_856 [Parachlamydiales bacterium]|nr:hypothetical protein [Parachlamydiales bacterium]
MNTLVRDFYRTEGKEEGLFSSALFLTVDQQSWEEASAKCSRLPRGWFELCHLPAEDRIEFVRDFWLNLLPYHPSFHLFLEDFFRKIEDITVVLTQSQKQGPWSVEMVYSLKDNRSFFRGLPPCNESAIDELKSRVATPFPRDYLAFLRIHNGFGKLSELGLLSVDRVVDAKQRLMDQYLDAERPLRAGNVSIDPCALIPFYESYGLGSYQCFFNEWYPGNEMGNVYLSGIDYTISDYADRKRWADHFAFPTFLDWLSFYLEGNSID